MDGHASDKISLVAAIEALAEQLRPEDEDDSATLSIGCVHRAATGQTIPS